MLFYFIVWQQGDGLELLLLSYQEKMQYAAIKMLSFVINCLPKQHLLQKMNSQQVSGICNHFNSFFS